MITHLFRTIISLSAFILVLAASATPNIQLKNKSKEAIQIDLKHGKIPLLRSGLETIQPQKSFESSVDTSKPITLELYTCRGDCKTKQPDVLTFTFSDSKGKAITGKTMYLKWDGKKLEPQQGKKGKTTDNYSLDNNIDSNDRIKMSEVKGKLLATGTQQATKAEVERLRTAAPQPAPTEVGSSQKAVAELLGISTTELNDLLSAMGTGTATKARFDISCKVLDVTPKQISDVEDMDLPAFLMDTQNAREEKFKLKLNAGARQLLHLAVDHASELIEAYQRKK